MAAVRFVNGRFGRSLGLSLLAFVVGAIGCAIVTQSFFWGPALWSAAVKYLESHGYRKKRQGAAGDGSMPPKDPK
jgi:hypothetical protein